MARPIIQQLLTLYTARWLLPKRSNTIVVWWNLSVGRKLSKRDRSVFHAASVAQKCAALAERVGVLGAVVGHSKMCVGGQAAAFTHPSRTILKSQRDWLLMKPDGRYQSLITAS
jgi:hypothetical protein